MSVDNTIFYRPNRKFPPILLPQMDNCISNNSNHYVFAFLSLLTSRKVFDIVEVGFLFMWHAHEDKDGTYERLLA